MELTITGYSTAMFSTWYFIEEWGLLLDAGDGVSAGLLQKSGKVEHIFVSHADRDHLTGLLQFNQLNARPRQPFLYYPQHSGSFPALEAFTKTFDPHVTGTVWTPLRNGQEVEIKDGLVVQAIRNGHVKAAPEVIKSLSYKVIGVKQKLKPELLSLSQTEITQIIREKGKAETTYEVRNTLLGYSGDTPVEDLQRWNHTEILIHEATFLEEGEERLGTDRNQHSRLHEVMEMVSTLNIKKLILGHFSSRYSAAQIDQAIRQLCDRYAINIPVYRILPGEKVHDILGQKPLNG